MNWLPSSVRDAFARLIGTVRRADIERRLAEEMQFHLDMQTARQTNAGLLPDEARRRAQVVFGGRDRFAEDARDEYRSRLLEETVQDVRHAVRALRRAPAFSSAVVLTLALGIGATTVIFSVADHVVLRPLAYRDSDRLVVVRESSAELRKTYPSLPANASHFLAWRRRCRACDDLAAIRATDLTMSGSGDPQRLGAARVSWNLFPMLGARAARGRLFTADDDQPDRNVVVLSDALWQREFGADPRIIGRTVRLNEKPWTVIGVMPPHFPFPAIPAFESKYTLARTIEVFIPLALDARERVTPGEYDYAVIGRRKPGVTLAAMRAEIDIIERDMSKLSPEPITLTSVLVPLQTQIVGSAGRALLLLLAAVGAVLLIVCVNLANLLLARNASRLRESAVRIALGAKRWRLVKETLTESVVLALTGGAVGLVLSYWGLAALLRLAPADLPRLGEVALDGRILAVSILIAMLAGLSFGVVPAVRCSRTNPGDALKSGGRTASEGRHSSRGRAALIASQTGLSTILLVAAGLFLASFVRVLRVDKGFDPERALAMDVQLPGGSYSSHQRRVQFFDEVRRRLAALPGVTASGMSSALPLQGEAQVDALELPVGGKTYFERPLANIRYVSPDYFAAIGAPIQRGQAFTESDRGRNVVVLSERAARLLWPGEDPIGKLVVPGSNDTTAIVVGIAADVRTTSLEREGSLAAFIPYWQNSPPTASLIVRTTGDPSAVAALARDAVRTVDPTVPVARIRTLREIVSTAIAARRFQLILLTLFAVTALLTASIGIYGVISHSLTRRTGEIGIRLALGARPSDVHRLVLGEGLKPSAIGIGAGIAVSVGIGRLFESLLFEVRASDPVTLACVAATLGLVGVLACYVPARRATRLGAARALRVE